MTKRNTKPKANTKQAARMSQPVRKPNTDDLAVLAVEFQGITAKLDELITSFAERLAKVEMRINAVIAMGSPPPERDEAAPNGVLRRRGSLFG